MRYWWLLSSVVLFTPSSSKGVQDPHQPDHTACTHFGLSSPSIYEGTIYVCPGDVVTDPKWRDPASDPVPLSVHEAVNKSQQALRHFDPKEKRWRVQEVSLTEAVDERWVYRIEWYVPNSEKNISYVVTLSGKVIAPELDSHR